MPRRLRSAAYVSLCSSACEQTRSSADKLHIRPDCSPGHSVGTHLHFPHNCWSSADCAVMFAFRCVGYIGAVQSPPWREQPGLRSPLCQPASLAPQAGARPKPGCARVCAELITSVLPGCRRKTPRKVASLAEMYFLPIPGSRSPVSHVGRLGSAEPLPLPCRRRLLAASSRACFAAVLRSLPRLFSSKDTSHGGRPALGFI